MAREKIEIKRIDKRSARQVTYSKRRKGLIKKAQEISILCDAEVALMVFSSTGKFTHYASTNLDQIIEKYLATKGSGQDEAQTSVDLTDDKTTFERLSKEVQEAETLLRQMQGENLESLSFKELEKLEKSIATGLNLVHKTKETKLMEENEQLRQQVNMLMAAKETITSDEEFRFSFDSINNSYYNNNNVSSLTNNESIDTTLRLGLSISD
ncbi:hypothetical protein LUZ60_005698 [Juncus effusus]|nr:hypothetical protein LUZ60_005698 [Juncus effusus]